MGNEKDVKKENKQEEHKELAPKRSMEDVLKENQDLRLQVKNLQDQVQSARAVAQAYANAQQNLINSIKGTINIAVDNLQLIAGPSARK